MRYGMPSRTVLQNLPRDGANAAQDDTMAARAMTTNVRRTMFKFQDILLEQRKELWVVLVFFCFRLHSDNSSTVGKNLDSCHSST